jgi:L-serine deaminase
MKSLIINTTLFAGFFTFLTTTDWIAFTGGVIGIIAGVIKILESLNNKKKYQLEIKLLEKKIKEQELKEQKSTVVDDNINDR